MTKEPTILTLPPEPEFADDALTVRVVERYAAPSDDAPERSVEAHGIAAERLLAPRSWLNREVSMQVEDLERAWRMIAEHAASELARLHEGKVPSRTDSGFSQFDQALVKIRTAPVVIHSLIDGAVNAAYYGSDES